ncbi:tetratricopeptide repeat-containing sensor histidine kinase [Psychroflexus sp. MES1-P1E]|uniref:tetratricopeptide repeat-containing sensor histidine kinase n=1 Tax=Psychroflexus sp. MES1-P1E TaxID=2058320 RepID=UPI000C7AB306|nr:tetratricopeptide repeat-containing sensor histidine kinase [Psychroflexus sp. MES1-P1E]PKG44275.1 histidine kinase [Psychroflexus sp. MES1-P1E]
MKFVIPVLFCLFFNLLSLANKPKIDSLKTKLSYTKVDTTRISILNQIATEFINVSYDSILPYSQKAFNLSSKIGFLKGKGIALKNKSIYYFYAGNQAESINKIEKAIQLFEEIEDNLELAKAYQNYGVLSKDQGDSKKALEKFRLSITYYQKANNQQGVIENLINSGNVYQGLGDFDQALEAFAKAKKFNIKLNNLDSRARIFSGEGLMAEKKGDFDEAIQKLTESLSLFKQLKNEKLICGMYNNLANISRKQGKYLESITYFENALTSAEKMNNPRLQGIILNNLANTYLNINDDDKAASLYKRAVSIIKDIDKITYASLLINLSLIQTKQKKYEVALKSLDSSLNIFRELGSKSYIVNNLFNIAHNHFKLNNLPKAKAFYVESRSIAEELEDQYSSLFIYNGLGEVYLKENKLDSAYYFASKAFTISKEIKALPEESTAAKLLYNISKSDGKAQDALEYLEVHDKLKDSLFNDEKSKALGILEAELGFKSLKEQLELEKLNQQLENEVKVNQRETLILVLAFAFLALIIVVVLLLKIKKNKTKANDLLSQKNNEIELKNLKLKESNLQKNKLFSIISHDLRSPVNSLSQIFDMYAAQQISDEEFKDWLPEINKNISSTRLLIDNLLNWASETLNKAQVEKSTFLLKPEVNSLYDLFYSPLKDKNIQFENNITEDFKIYIDINTLKLVVRNLISNAIKFCNAEDKISISATHFEKYDRICVQDTGVGMTSEVAKHLFSNSSITSSLGTKKEKGKGVGTVLCKTFIEENGGSIWVDFSEEGKGTRICFEVPNQPKEQ